MTSHHARLYALALSILVFFVTWAAVSARPWVAEPEPSAAPSAEESAALRARERALRKQIAAARDLLGSQAVDEALPAVQVVQAPPVTVTRSS
jgi:hypothetical protein